MSFILSWAKSFIRTTDHSEDTHDLPQGDTEMYSHQENMVTEETTPTHVQHTTAQQHTPETTVQYAPVQSTGVQQYMPVQSTDVQQFTPVQSTGVQQYTPVQPTGVQQYAPVQSTGVQQYAPVQPIGIQQYAPVQPTGIQQYAPVQPMMTQQTVQPITIHSTPSGLVGHQQNAPVQHIGNQQSTPVQRVGTQQLTDAQIPASAPQNPTVNEQSAMQRRGIPQCNAREPISSYESKRARTNAVQWQIKFKRFYGSFYGCC